MTHDQLSVFSLLLSLDQELIPLPTCHVIVVVVVLLAVGFVVLVGAALITKVFIRLRRFKSDRDEI